jgi:hypothetical protein
MDYNERTGAYRIRLVNGDPVETDDCTYAVLSMLCEDPGWLMEETPREGNLVQALAETTVRTRGDTKAAVEQRLRHLIDDGVLVDARCTDVSTYDMESGGREIDFAATIQKPGQSPRAVQAQLRGT